MEVKLFAIGWCKAQVAVADLVSIHGAGGLGIDRAELRLLTCFGLQGRELEVCKGALLLPVCFELQGRAPEAGKVRCRQLALR